LIWAVVCIISFWIGYWASDRRLETRASESARIQVKEFVMFADGMGFLDRAKLDEALIAARAIEGN
jgi:hypothetical protein